MGCQGRFDGFENMRRDGELLAEAELGRVGCRVYGWDGVWVSLGRFQSPEEDLVHPESTRWVMRPTGGKAVLHGHDVTVGLALPLDLLPNAKGPGRRGIYCSATQPIIAALNLCGVRVALAERTPFSQTGRQTSDCFAFSSPNDIVDLVTGRKVCGCALRLTRLAVLVQASIPNGKPLVDPRDVIVDAEPPASHAWDASHFTSALEEALGGILA